MMGLPEGIKRFKIGLAVLIQYRRMTSASHLASHVAVWKYALCISASRSKNLLGNKKPRNDLVDRQHHSGSGAMSGASLLPISRDRGRWSALNHPHAQPTVTISEDSELSAINDDTTAFTQATIQRRNNSNRGSDSMVDSQAAAVSRRTE